MFQGLPHSLATTLRHGLRLLVIVAIMMGVGRLVENLPGTFAYLTNVQRQSLVAVEGINPFQIGDRFVCALTPSVESMNRENPGALYHPPVSSDCMYRLSPATARPDAPAPSGAALPAPVVGHWAETEGGHNANGIISVVYAFFDTVWHLLVQPSIFASIFAVFAFVLGATLAVMLMALLTLTRITLPPLLVPLLLFVGSIAGACLAAWGLQMIIEGGLWLFSGITQLAGLCCATASITVFGYNVFAKVIEVRVHEAIEHIVPH